MIMNLAFKEVMRVERFDCVVFHDVDMIPQNDRNIYECMQQPRHLSPGLDEMRFTYVVLWAKIVSESSGQDSSSCVWLSIVLIRRTASREAGCALQCPKPKSLRYNCVEDTHTGHCLFGGLGF